MKKHLSFLGAVLTAGVLAVPAYAADSSYYVSGDAGVSLFSNITPKDPTTQIQQGTLTTSAGIDVLGAVGMKFDSWRVEGEFGYQRNNAKQISDNTGLTLNATGNISVTSLLANGYYDFIAGGVNPYLSAGIGWASVGINNVGVVGQNYSLTSESHSALGYQFGAGVAIPLSKSIDLDARYRYFGTGNISMNNQGGDYKVTGSDFLVGLRIGF